MTSVCVIIENVTEVLVAHGLHHDLTSGKPVIDGGWGDTPLRVQTGRPLPPHHGLLLGRQPLTEPIQGQSWWQVTLSPILKLTMLL